MIPETLLNDVRSGECVLFLGAGASTEGSLNFGKGLMDLLVEKCKYPATSPKSLPKVARYFCDTMDGGFKGRLLRETREYLDQYMENSEANNSATMVHRIVAKIGFFQVIITTNWDVFMERELCVLPIVRDTDLVYWNSSKRQVIKLHGCISQPETMIITEDDYKNFLKNRIDCPISNKLKDLMATKTFLFLGYSLEDQSFQILQEDVLSRMGKFSRTSYAVLSHATRDYIWQWKKRGITIVPGNALAFLRDVHKIFVEEGIYAHTDVLSTLLEFASILKRKHFSTGQEDRIGIFSTKYQDGWQHELDEAYYGIMRGKQVSFFDEQLRFYGDKVLYWTIKGNPTEISYNRGREEFLLWILDVIRLGHVHFPKLYVNNDLEPIREYEFDKLRKSGK